MNAMIDNIDQISHTLSCQAWGLLEIFREYAVTNNETFCRQTKKKDVYENEKLSKVNFSWYKPRCVFVVKESEAACKNQAPQ